VPADVSEVKLLVEHSQRESVGYAVQLEEREDGLWGTFHVPEGDPEGDLALTRASNRVRNAFSVGVDLDNATLERARRSRDGKPIAAQGALRETSLVSVPAFTGARVTDVAASSSPLVVAAWHTIDPTPPNGRTRMNTCQTCGQELQLGVAHTCQTTATAAQPAVTQEQLQAAIAGLLGVTPEHAAATAPETPAAAPSVAAGAATTQLVSEPATYSWDGAGNSFIRDLWEATQNRNAEAAGRLDKFGRELADSNPRTVASMLSATGAQDLMRAAVETRTTAPEVVNPEVYRGDLLVQAIDRGRPIFQRMRNVRLTDATPFRVPTEGEFTGVGAHTEGTAHVAEGTLTLGNVTVEPGAISGAYRFSRELADSSNPAIDGIALRAMMREYRYESEDMVAAALALTAAGAAKPYAAELVDTPAELRAQIIAMALANGDIPPDYGFAGAGFFTTMATATADDGRPYFPPLNPTNAAGTSNLRQLTINADFTTVAASSKVDTDEAFLVTAEDVLVGESGVLSFRFDQPEGPGIIKVAIWGYQVAQVMRDSGVRRLSKADEA
jgi:HK97 family phage prohead protease